MGKKYATNIKIKNNWKLWMAKMLFGAFALLTLMHQHTGCKNWPQGVTLKHCYSLCISAPLAAVQTCNPHITLKISVWHIHTK